MTSIFKQCKSRNPRHTPRERRGFAVVATLTCLLIVVAILGSMLQGAIRARRHLHTERDCRQTELLLAAGAARVAARLEVEPSFRGDVWDLPAESIVGRGAGRVTTEVSRDGADQSWQVHVIAQYPVNRAFSIRRSNTFHITTSQE